MSSRMWTGFSRCSCRSSKNSPSPHPSPRERGEGDNHIVWAGFVEKSGLMTWPRCFDDIRQHVEQVCHLEWLAETWPLGVLAGQHAIAGDKDKGDIPLGQYVGDRGNPFPRQIDLEPRHVADLHIRRIERLRKSRDWSSHDASGRCQHVFHQSRDKIFGFDDSSFDTLELR